MRDSDGRSIKLSNFWYLLVSWRKPADTLVLQPEPGLESVFSVLADRVRGSLSVRMSVNIARPPSNSGYFVHSPLCSVVFPHSSSRKDDAARQFKLFTSLNESDGWAELCDFTSCQEHLDFSHVMEKKTPKRAVPQFCSTQIMQLSHG